MFRSLISWACVPGTRMQSRMMSDQAAEFRTAIKNSKKITVLTGAGISAESGVPTFRGAGGLWREWNATELATPQAFAADPSLVWEFYHYRRCIVSKVKPNVGHSAITALEQRCEREGKDFKLLTQNIDGLHIRAGTKNMEELHGSMWKTRCLTCNEVKENFEMPICPALEGKGAPDPSTPDARIPTIQLPRCKQCNGLLRPHVVWFGECLDVNVMDRAHEALTGCDLLIVAGTSAVVQPAAGFIPIVKGSGGRVAEFNLEETPASRYCRYRFQGTCAETLPHSLGLSPEELQSVFQP